MKPYFALDYTVTFEMELAPFVFLRDLIDRQGNFGELLSDGIGIIGEWD